MQRRGEQIRPRLEADGRQGSVRKRKARDADRGRRWNEKEAHEKAHEERMDRLIAGLTPRNAALLDEFRREKRRLGNQPSSMEPYVSLAVNLEVWTNGAALDELSAEQAGSFLDHVAKQVAGDTVALYAGYVRHLVRWVHDLEGHDLPKGFRRATNFRKPKHHAKRRPILDEHMALLVEHYEDDLMWQSV